MIVHFALIILTFVPYRRTCLTDLIVKSEKVLFIVRSHEVYVRKNKTQKTILPALFVIKKSNVEYLNVHDDDSSNAGRTEK